MIHLPTNTLSVTTELFHDTLQPSDHTTPHKSLYQFQAKTNIDPQLQPAQLILTATNWKVKRYYRTSRFTGV